MPFNAGNLKQRIALALKSKAAGTDPNVKGQAPTIESKPTSPVPLDAYKHTNLSEIQPTPGMPKSVLAPVSSAPVFAHGAHELNPGFFRIKAKLKK